MIHNQLSKCLLSSHKSMTLFGCYFHHVVSTKVLNMKETYNEQIFELLLSSHFFCRSSSPHSFHCLTYEMRSSWGREDEKRNWIIFHRQHGERLLKNEWKMIIKTISNHFFMLLVHRKLSFHLKFQQTSSFIQWTQLASSFIFQHHSSRWKSKKTNFFRHSFHLLSLPFPEPVNLHKKIHCRFIILYPLCVS